MCAWQGEGVLDSLNLVSVGLAECICTAVDMLHTVHGDGAADTIVASPLAPYEGNREGVGVPIDVQEEAASEDEFVGVPQQPSSPPPPDTLVKVTPTCVCVLPLPDAVITIRLEDDSCLC